MKKLTLKPVAVAIGLVLAAPAFAAGIDFTGSNIYMKFLDGNQRQVSGGSIDTSSGSDQGQFTELELRIKATISKQVEAGARVQSRSSGSYWSEFGGFADENSPIKAKNMKLRGAYVNLTPGYSWLTEAMLGSSDWGMFDPFTVGQMRYIDRDNINGVYFRGPVPMAGATWEAAWISLAEYLGPNFSTGDLKKNDGTFIGQFKLPLGRAKFSASLQQTTDREKDPADTNLLDGQSTVKRFKNTVAGLKASGSVIDGLDLKAAYYRSTYRVSTAVQNWSNLLGADYNDNAFHLTADWSETPVRGLGVSFQYFNIGAGYVSAVGSRREADVLLTEGSESAWYNWGDTRWLGGLANDMQQVPVTIRDNDYIDFDEPGAESAIGRKGATLLLKYELANSPMSLELTRIGYNQNWQDWGGNKAVFDVISWAGATGPGFKQFQDRSTNLVVFKASHVFDVAGGLETSFKWKRMKDKDNGQIGNAADDRDTKDNGYTFTVGNQLFRDLYGSLSYGRYTRDITKSGMQIDNQKSILSARLAYNLPGFEAGALAQWIDGKGDPGETGTRSDLRQYRLKMFLKALF